MAAGELDGCLHLHTSQEAKRRMLRPHLLSLVFSGNFACGMVLPTFMVGLPISIKLYWKYSYVHAQRFVF